MLANMPSQFQPNFASEDSSRPCQALYCAFEPRVQVAPLIDDPPPSVLPLCVSRPTVRIYTPPLKDMDAYPRMPPFSVAQFQSSSVKKAALYR